MNLFFITVLIWLVLLIQTSMSHNRIKIPYIRLSILWLLGEREEVKRIVAQIRYMQKAQHAVAPAEEIVRRDIDEMLEHEVWKLEHQKNSPQLYFDENVEEDNLCDFRRLPPIIEFCYLAPDNERSSESATAFKLMTKNINLHRSGLTDNDKEKVALLYSANEGNELHRFLTSKGVI